MNKLGIQRIHEAQAKHDREKVGQTDKMFLMLCLTSLVLQQLLHLANLV